MPDDILILEPGDERAQKIAKAISSPTAGDILNQMKEGGHTATQLSESLDLPLTTIQYHLENLVGADMLDVIEKRWSKKGREIKVYGLRNQVVIVAPRPGDVRSLLLKYASLFAIVILAGVVLFTLLALSTPGAVPPLQEKGSSNDGLRVNSVPAPVIGAVGTNYLPIIFFILGGGVTILTLALFELKRRHASRD
jgi:DNA-binding transcriptional ArsR family regulator